MANFTIASNRILSAAGELAPGALTIAGDAIIGLGPTTVGHRNVVEAGNLLVLPGLVDLHGDAFERQLMPRPGVHFPVDLALHDTDRQLCANGITTAFHAVTLSWEPGLRCADAAVAMVDALHRLRPALACDTRLHLRFETYALDGVGLALDWLGRGRVDFLAFNDHTPGMLALADTPERLGKHADRAGMSAADFAALTRRVAARQAEVPVALARLAAAARRAGVAMASHDDETPARRAWYRDIGCRVSEFPETRETAAAAIAAGEHVVFGAPNVVRGGSHAGHVAAAAMVGAGLCDVLASDYYYPALLQAPFRLAADGVQPLARAWALVSANAAAASGLSDRGTLAPGKRADLVLVDDSDPALPRIVATLVAGRPVYRGPGAPALPP